MFQSKHISSSGKRGEKTWSNRSCFSQVWLGWWWVPQVKRWDWVLKIFVKNMSCTTNFVNSIFDWSQTFSFLALILMKYETSWKSMFKIYITYCNAAGTSFSRLGLRKSLLGGSSTPASRFFEQSFFSVSAQDLVHKAVIICAKWKCEVTLLFRWNQASWALTNSRVWPTGDLGLGRSSLCFCFPFN